MFYRHGDLVLQTIHSIPDGAKSIQVGRDNKLALGEVTGHSHQLNTTVDVEVFEFGGDKYFKLLEPATLTHEEHKLITLEPAVYKGVIKREFDYFSEELKKVTD